MKFIWVSLVFVLLTLPLATEEFSFGFGENEDDEQQDDTIKTRLGSDGGSKELVRNFAKRRTTNKKFKFHKIERVYVDDYIEDETDNGRNDDNDNSNDNDNINDNNNYDETDNDNTERDIDDDDETDAASSRTNEAEEFQFERAHNAQKRRRTKSSSTPDSGERITSARTTTTEGSFLGNIYNSIFGGERVAEPQQTSSNNIIDWLMWLGEQTGRLRPAEPTPPPAEKQTTLKNWLSYLNRWPFNSIFPFGQPAKPVHVPRRGRVRGKSASGDDEASAEAQHVPEPMSQEHFETLLHTLPAFVTNPAYVDHIECRQQLQIFHRQLRAHKLWTLQMLDATGKITSGILRGNINQLGDFDLCTQLRTIVKVTPETPVRIRGKYCLAQIETQTVAAGLKVPVHLAHGRGLWNGHLGNPGHFVPRYAVANWGICIPQACSAASVRTMLETNLRPYNNTGVEFHIEVDDDDCVTRQSRRFMRLMKKDTKFGAAITSIAALFLISLLALLSEHWPWIQIQLQKLQKRDTPEVAAKEVNDETNEANGEDSATSNSEETAPDTETVHETVEVEPVTETEAESETVPQLDVNSSFKLFLLELFHSFSPDRAVRRLLERNTQAMELPLLHVLKLGATFMLYICLKYLMIGHLPISNRDSLVRAMEQPWSILFRAPLIYSDILLLIAGFMAAFQLSEEMEQKSYIQLLKRVASKAIRYLPAVFLVLCFQTWVLPKLGAGPLWNKLVGEHARLCEQQMWRNALSIQNVIDFEETCSPMSIQLALDVQLYLLGPLIVWLYYTDPDASFFAYGALHLVSVAARYARTNQEHLSMTLFHGMNVSKFYRTANLIYASPISRATPYLLGIGAGLLYRSEHGNLEIIGNFVPIGWLLAALSIGWCFWSPAAGMRTDYIYTPNTAAGYAAWSPLILGLAICWCIFMFPRNENSLLSSLCSTRPIILLSRITFPMQLVMYLVVLWNTATIKETIKYHVTELINFQEIVTIVCLGAILAVFIDVPAQQIRHLLVNRIFMERTSQEEESEPISGAEHSDNEPSEATNATSEGPATSDTPEPPDTIWASDPEEEEQKYLERRRSSVLSTDDDVKQVAKKQTETKEVEEKEKDKAEEEEEEEEEEEDEETEIEEAAEVKKRPNTPPPAPVPKKEPTPPPAPTTTRRRRQPISDT